MLYAGRRGAITALVEATNGNLHAGQALARHATMTTTAKFYKKQITPNAFAESMKMLQSKLDK